MLQELTIKNFAIIDSLALSFEEGMTVLTGETGAGKSIIFDALGLLIGGRGSADFIRHGEQRLELQGLFSFHETNTACKELLDENGIEFNDNEVILERSLHKSGKNTCRINGKLVTTTFLRQLGSRLLDIHSQHEHQELMDENYHLPLLDRFIGNKIAKRLENYQTAYENYQALQKEWQNWTKNEQEIARRIDMLHFQQEEIQNAELTLEEEEQLLEQKTLLMNFEKINDSLQGAYNALLGEPGGIEYIGEAMQQMQSVADLNTDYQALTESVSSSFYILEDAASQIRQSLDQLEYQPGTLEQIEVRLNELNQLKRKYGKTIEAIIQYEETISTELEKLTNSETHIDQLEEKLAKQKVALEQQAEEMTVLRKKAALELEQQIQAELKELYMEKAVFQVQFLEGKTLGPLGQDHIAFYITTNPGEPLKSLAKVASGGELSRMMLALKTIFSKHQSVTSIIFDEVDTGVSGRVAQAIAEKIYGVSIGSQVLCISHLPQVAAMADHHYYITKHTENDRTSTKVEILEENEKIDEISRMIAGIEVTELTRNHAREMISQAGKVKTAVK
ncbi:Recombination protein N [Listeria grayi]|uniref:DNA repair protein RecN n=1 Tax=Listeria grayi FSL F6-1183 TaxID=1265827 RepID=A0A829RAF4_LISGR|nr:DNA repair protein RecN [Listeria grayi]EUJ30037.1 DNA repair protein [Listeria grayi FSL F6-1183]VEI33914.1 Recombination protein N [Listeria grayi]